MRLRNTFDRPVWGVVLSPEYDDRDSYGPPDPGRDVLFAFTRAASTARRLAVRAWRRGWWKGCHRGKTVCSRQPYIVRYSDENPLAVVTVERYALTGPVSYRVRP